jgi:hypothetical protein
LPCSEVHKPKGSTPSLNDASLQSNSYEIGQPSWIKKQINADTLENHLVSTTTSYGTKKFLRFGN